MFQRNSSFLFSAGLLAGAAALGFFVLTGCGAGPLATGNSSEAVGSSNMSGILHGGPNPVVGSTVTLYVASNAATVVNNAYSSTATAVATTLSLSDGSFSLTLPTTGVACPSGSYAYLTAYGGSGGSGTNSSILLMVPIGLCDSNYTSSNVGPVYTNTYTGQSLWVDELTTVVSAYALGGFMSVTNAGVVNIGAAANNTTSATATTPSAAGLAHAFANALAILNTHTGQPNAYTHGGTSNSTGGVIPDAEIFLLGNILQACVNSTGVSGTITATANDGTACGKLFSYVTPPQNGASVPTNTLQAMLDLVKYPNPSVNTWNTGCTAAGSGTTTATNCLFGLAPTSGAYANALTGAPPDWTLAIVYTSGYGLNTTATGCTVSPFCPGLTYPYYVALDLSDNVYVLNYSGSTTTFTNIIGVGYDGTPIFSTPEDTTDLAITTIGTDTASHVFGVNTAASGSALKVYSATSGSVLTTVTTGLGAMSGPVLADPLNNIYIASAQASINIRKATYTTGPSYAVAAITTSAPNNPIQQISYGTNLDFYLVTGPTSSPLAYLYPNTGTYTKGTAAAGSYSATGLVSAAPSGTTSNAYGISGTSVGNAIVIDSAGAIPITKVSNSSITAGSAVALPTVYNSTLYNRALAIDGANTAFSPDGGNGSIVSGVSVYDSTDGLALGTYKGCYVINKACGTTAGQVPMYSPRGAAIDSAGDVWVVSGASANLTELIGVAAPTWPALSLGLKGLPQ